MAFGFIKKTWKDRISEYPTRRTLTKEDGSTELVTVSRSEGTVSQEGDAFSADNLNDLETRVDDAFTEVYSNLLNIPRIYAIQHNGTTAKTFTLPKNLGLTDAIICNSSWGGVSGSSFVLAGYGLYYGAAVLHNSFTIPAPSTNSAASSTVTLTSSNEITVKTNSTNTIINIMIITGGVVLE